MSGDATHDQVIDRRISELVEEEHALERRLALPLEPHRLERIAAELDQCCDRLRQRHARIAAALDADAARPSSCLGRSSYLQWPGAATSHSFRRTRPYDSIVAPVTPTNPNLQLALTSIGEFGLDPRNGTIFDPQNTADVMSYCGPNNWISKCLHRIVYRASILNPQTLPVGAATASGEGAGDETIVDKTPVIAIWGTWMSDDRVDVSTVMRLETTPQEGVGTSLIAELVGDDGEVLTAAKVVARRLEGGVDAAVPATTPA